MTQIHKKSLDKSVFLDRIVGKVIGKSKGPTVVYFGGIHGNETAGVFALREVFSKINPDQTTGTVYGITGNIKALNCNQRYIKEDLNRIWLKENLRELQKKKELSNEEEEQKELYSILRNVLKRESGPFYFIDLHTTSSKTLPFITINDALINRNFSKLFPVPIVLGIEEYLEGPLLSYINQLGYVSLGFESGQHTEEMAITNAVAFIFLSLVFTKTIKKSNVSEYDSYYSQLKTEAKNTNQIFEVVYLHKIKQKEIFKMKNGFKSFQNVNKGELLATSNKNKIVSPYKAKIFMPLYQTKGKEGFFIIKKIHPFFLKLSEILRRVKIDSLLIVFPGITWKNKEEGVLQVDLKIAKFMAKPFFHLLGYRNKQFNKTHLFLFNRERSSKKRMYKNQLWYKKTTH